MTLISLHNRHLMFAWIAFAGLCLFGQSTHHNPYDKSEGFPLWNLSLNQQWLLVMNSSLKCVFCGALLSNTFKYMDYYKEEKIKVCWHEIGHFVTAYYNQLCFGGHGSAAMYLTRMGAMFKGAHEPQKPADYEENGPINQPAAKIASLAYGCFFQIIQQGNREELNACFDMNTGCRGMEDYQEVAYTAASFKIYTPDTGMFYDCIDAHFNRIRYNPEFTDLFAKNIYHLVESTEDVVHIDLNSVQEIVVDFLPLHEGYYVMFVKELEEIFDTLQE